MLTKNEKKVLQLLIDHARIQDVTIAKKINITPQAVRKIRIKLEKDYINEYRTIPDYEKMGITTFAIAQIKLTNKEILKSKNIIGAFEINEANITHILILGFKSLEELDNYKKTLNIQKINIISKKGLLKNSPVELLKQQLI